VRYALATAVGRLVRLAARLRKAGGGSAIPGFVVNRIAPGYLKHALESFPQGLVIVSGSSGKSTTTKMLVAMLRAHGVTVFTNPSTANIRQGLTSSLLDAADWRGRVPGELAVLEMDEGHGALIMRDIDARVVCLTNVMVDQIDRFHDSEMVTGMLRRLAARATEAVVINADDASLARLATDITVAIDQYGASAAVFAASPRGLGYEQTVATRMATTEGIVVASTQGTVAELLDDGTPRPITLPAEGAHYAIDAAAAYATARRLLGNRFDPTASTEALSAMPPVFGRGERVVVRGQEVDLVLVQNPASFQLNVDSVAGARDILCAMGSDVRDPSYLWPVDLSGLGRVSIVSGSKSAEAALMLAYSGVVVGRVEPDLARALEEFLAPATPGEVVADTTAAGDTADTTAAGDTADTTAAGDTADTTAAGDTADTTVAHATASSATAGHTAATGGTVKTIIFTADAMRRTRAHLGLTEAE